MTDILERLRKREMLAKIGQDKPEIYRDAADEIERLRKDVKTAIMGDSAELRDAKKEIERFKREAEIRLDQVKREQEAHLRTITDYNRAAVDNAKLREALNTLAKHCNEMEAQNHDYHTMGEGGSPCLSQPLAKAYAELGERDEA